MSKKWIIKMDVPTTETTYFAVEAKTRDEAIEKVMSGEVDAFNTETTGIINNADFSGSHEASDDELECFEL